MTAIGKTVLVLGALVALGACDGAVAPPDDSHGAQIVIIGRAEIGQLVQIGVVRGADTAVAPSATVSFAPANAATASTLIPNGYRLNTAGTVSVSVEVSPATVRGLAVTVAPPPKIVFDMSVAGNRDVYRATIYGNEVERLTVDAADDIDPTSAKGTLVFASHRTGNAELYLTSATAGSTMRLTTTSANETEPSLSPDATRIAYVRDDGNVPRVWMSSATSTGSVALTAGFGFGGSVEASPAWNSASDSVVLMATVPASASIFVSSRAAGSTPVSAARPATADSVHVEPTWSADGKSIAFCASRVGGSARIAVLTRSTGAIAMITPVSMSVGQPTFIPDGRIVFTVFAAGGATSLAWVDPAKPGEVHAIPLTGLNPQRPAIIWP